MLEVFVNELSLTPEAADVPSAHVRAEQFVHTIRAATVRGVQRILHTPEDFFAKVLAPAYSWYKWFQDSRVERELRQYFLSLATKVPYLRGDSDAEARWGQIDCRWQQQLTLGLKAAYVTDGLAVSIASADEWNSGLLKCQIEEIVDEEISTRSENIHHASNAAHLELHSDWIHYRIKSTVANGEELWIRISELFPCLLCCDAVKDQMMRLPTESLPAIIRGLFRLNAFCVSWVVGPFEPTAIACTVSPESQSTLKMYGAERTFLCPDGQKRTFSWHAKVGRWRIHFDPTPGPGRLFIGYLGKHLPIATRN